MNLNAARVFVKNLASARAFYAETLGLPLKADGSRFGYCVFGAGSMELVVEAVPDDAPDDEQVLVGRFTGLSFDVSDVAMTYQELEALGVVFTGKPEQQQWGGILATLQDPDGNSLQIVQRPTGAAAEQDDMTIPILPSRSMDGTLAFYGRLGFEGEVMGEGDSYAILTRGRLELHFFLHTELVPAESSAGCYIRVANVEALYQAFASAKLPFAGIPRMHALEDKPWGMKEFAVIDDDGNLLRIGQEI